MQRRLIVTQILQSSNGRLDHLLFLIQDPWFILCTGWTSFVSVNVGGVVWTRSCRDTRNDLVGLAVECCPEILSSALCQSCFEMPASSLEMTGRCPLKTLCPEPLSRTQLPGHRPQAWKIMQMVMFNTQAYQTKSYSNSLEETLNRVCYPVTHATWDGFVFYVVGIQYSSQISVLQDLTTVYK